VVWLPQITFLKNVVVYQTENRTLWEKLGFEIIHSVPAGEKRVLVSEVLNDEIISYVADGGCLLLLNPKGFYTVDFKAGFGSLGGYFFTKPAHYPPYEDGN